MRKSASRIITFIFHLGAIAVLIFILQPIASWFLSKTPALGVDLYNSVTYVSYHLKNFSLPFNSFKDFWFAGYPLIFDFPQLPFYLMLPFGAKFGATVGVQLFTVFSLFLLIFFSYLLFYELSQNSGLSIFLSALVLLSPNIYGSATWAGSIPYFASQALFPFGLFWGVKYLKEPNYKLLSLLVLVSGVGILIHPFGTVTFLIPSLLLIILLGGLISYLSFGRILKHAFLFILGVIFASFSFSFYNVISLFTLRVLPQIIVPTATSRVIDQSEIAMAIASFYKAQIALLYTQTNFWIFVSLIAGFIVFILSTLFSKNKRKALLVIPLILIAVYTAAHPAVNLAGILSFLYHQPYRAFWPFPIAVGAVTAGFWGSFFSLLREKLKARLSPINVAITAFVTAGLFVLAYFIFISQVSGVLETLVSGSEYSSAFPEALSIKFKKEDQEQLRGQLTPSFIDPGDKNKRLYEADAAVNIWWNAFFDMPMARGYIDPPIGTERRWGFFWLDIAIANDTLVREFGVEPSEALANSLFLIDWYGIYYFEGGRLGSKGPSPPPSSYLLEAGVFDREEEVTTYGAVLRYQTESGKPELHMELPQTLKFYKVAAEHTSPILYPTNAPAVIIFSDAASYEDFLRILATQNLNSRKIVPVYGGEFIDKFKLEELKSFEAVIASQYKARNPKKAFKLLEDYVRGGGRLFVDTGAQARESESLELPEIFPIKTSQRQGQGRFWDFTVADHTITQDIDFSNFGPPVFSGDEWKLSVPRASSDLREDSTVILKHRDKPILIERKFGQGRVVWSGMSLFYHFDQYKSAQEAKLFINILRQFTTFDEADVLEARVEWIEPERVVISTDKSARGILFKEQGYPGWSARLVSPGGKNLPIYLTGPTFPGFMYVPLKDQGAGPVNLQFSYRGEPLYWVVAFINFAVIILILEGVLFDGRLVGQRLSVFYRDLVKKIGFWWEREEQ